MLYLYSPGLIATANKTLQHYSAAHHLLFQKNKATELRIYFFFFWAKRNFCRGNNQGGAGNLTQFSWEHSAFNPTAALVPAKAHRTFICRDLLPFNALSTCIPSWWWGALSTICCLTAAPRWCKTCWRLHPVCRGTHRAQKPADTTVMDTTTHPAKGCTYAGGSALSPLSSLGAGCIQDACNMES